MIKSKAARVVGFVGALGLSASLLGAAATTTGAYFTDSESGSFSAKSGTLTVDKASSFNLGFDRMMPGEDQSRSVSYTTGGDARTDIWLHFPDGASYAAFTGAKGGAYNPNGGLGRYGHFAVKNNAGAPLFSSYNLQNESDTKSGCADANGHGSNQPATSPTDTSMGFCGVPHYIKLESNVPAGTTLQSTLVFGLTGRARGQNADWVKDVPFEVVATQVGIRPDAQHF